LHCLLSNSKADENPKTASAHALPSPDGTYIATVLNSKLILRSTRSLEILRVIALPAEIASSTQWFLWSPSSKRILICAADCICVYSTTNQQFAAKVSNPTSGTAKITSISFGATHDEILIFADFGLKLTVFTLSTSTSFEIASPKLYSPGNSSRGYAYRPRTSSLALLTRSGGRDILSIHARHTYEVLRSWNSDTVDAQGLSWSPDGRWLAVVDSAGQGHKILFYTADGHLFKVWNGPTPTSHEDRDLAMGAGVKLLEWASTGDYLAVGDYSSRFVLLSTSSFMVTLNLNHTITIKPVNGLQVRILLWVVSIFRKSDLYPYRYGKSRSLHLRVVALIALSPYAHILFAHQPPGHYQLRTIRIQNQERTSLSLIHLEHL
jgi:WD40 repeat protein